MNEKSKRKMESYGKEFKQDPINVYYQYKQPLNKEGNSVVNSKIRVLKKGDTIFGEYLHTFEKGMFKTHLIKTEIEGTVTVKGNKKLNSFVQDRCKRGTYVELTYKGEGKALEGQRPPFMWDLKSDTSNLEQPASKVEYQDPGDDVAF